MATRIRLQRHGKKRYPYYHIVVADSRVKRDGAKIERIGDYDPNKNPAIINLDFDRALYWLQTGAQPSDTCRAILSYKGVMHKNHLLNGVKKGAFDEAEANKKYDAWFAEKEAKLMTQGEALAAKADADEKAILAAEKEISDKRAAAILAKTSPIVEEVAPSEAADAVATEAGDAVEAPTEEAKTEEAPKAEEAPKEEVKVEEAPKAEEAPKEEVKVEEAPKEAPKEEVKAKEEAPKKEAKADDLTKVEGIGPKIAEVLNGKDIRTFAELAAAKADDIKTILTEAEGNFGSHEPTTWPMQAKMAADGKWDELKKWQDESDGGKPIEAKAEEEE